MADTVKTLTEARRDLAKLVDRVRRGRARIVLTRNRKRAAALVSPDDLELLEAIEDAIDIQEAQRILRRIKATGEKLIPLSQVKKDLRL